MYGPQGHLTNTPINLKDAHMKVGVLEILNHSVAQDWIQRIYNARFRRHYASITPQAVAVWCRQLGHTVYYATYYGQKDPKRLLPDSLDVVFISTYVSGRHDACIVPRAAVVVEAMMAITLTDLALRAGMIPRVIK